MSANAIRLVVFPAGPSDPEPFLFSRGSAAAGLRLYRVESSVTQEDPMVDETLAFQLADYRALLKVLVRQMELNPHLERRFDSSDLVHETLLKAHVNRHAYQGSSERELVGWLK